MRSAYPLAVYLIFRADKIDPRLKDFTLKLSKKDFIGLHCDFVLRTRTHEFLHRIINKILVDIMLYDVVTLEAVHEANSRDYKVWCSDIIMYFYYKENRYTSKKILINSLLIL